MLLFGPDEACVDPSEGENGVVEVEVPFDSPAESKRFWMNIKLSPAKRSRALKLTILTFIIYKFYRVGLNLG